MRYIKIMLAMLLLALIPCGVQAQSLDDAEIVREAVRQTAAVPYRFMVETNVTQRLVMTDQEVTTTTSTRISGAVNSMEAYTLEANALTSNSQNDESMEVVLETQWTVIDGVEYLYIVPDENLQRIIRGEPGWWRYNDLLAYQDTGVGAVYLQSLVSAYQPPHAEFAQWLILTASERTQETHNGQTMRVFDITLSPLTALANVSSDQGLFGRLGTVLRDLDVLFAGDFEHHAEVWVGAEDGLLHRVSYHQRADIPFLSAGLEKGPNWDSFLSAEASFELIYGGEPITVTAPESFNRPAIFP